MDVLVTGGTGLVGSHCVRALRSAGHRVRVLARDPGKAERVFGGPRPDDVMVGNVTDPRAVADALSGMAAVVHCAAVVSTQARRAREVLDTNLRAVELVVGGAANSGVPYITYISSATVLFAPGTPIDANRPPATPHGAYARSKADGERFVRALQDCGAPICILYPPGVVGPDDPGLSEGNHAIRALLTQLILDTATGFEALDARDLAAVIAAFLAGTQCGRHVVSGRYLPWPDMIALFDDLTGRQVRRLRTPGSVMRAAGKVADRVNAVIPFDFPLSSESMDYATRWPGTAPSPALAATGVQFRTARETYADTIRWLYRAGHITASHGGRLAC